MHIFNYILYYIPFPIIKDLNFKNMFLHGKNKNIIKIN